MPVEVKRVIDLTPEEYKQCKRLCFRETGFMYYDIARARNNELNYPSNRRFSKVVLITESNRLAAWALLTPRKVKGYNAQFYTRAALRNQGLGSKLMEEVRKIEFKPYVIPHDYRSGGFFKKSKDFVKIDGRGYRKYME